MLCRRSVASAVHQHTCLLLEVLAVWERLTLHAPACLLLQVLSWLEPLLELLWPAHGTWSPAIEVNKCEQRHRCDAEWRLGA